MLATIRSKTTGLVAKILFGALILAFALWGIGDIFRGDKAAKPVAQVGDLQYSQNEFRRDLKQALDNFTRTQHFQITAQQFAQFGGLNQVLGGAQQRLMWQVFADRQGLGVSQEAAVAEIQADPEFQDSQRKFDRNRFLVALDQASLSEAGYVERIRQMLVFQAIQNAMFGGIAVPAGMAKDVYLYAEEQRSADVLVIPTTAMTGIAAPDDAALQQYQKDHADNYKAPEYRAATAITVAPADLAGEIAVSDDEIKQEYEAQKAQFTTPDVREVEQVVVQDQAQADKIEAAVKGGTAFPEAVKSVTGGDPVPLGKITKEKLPAEIADKVFALAAGAVSEPLTSPFGIHVVHVISSEPGGTKPLDEVKDQVKKAIALTRASDALDSIVKELDDALAGGASLDDAATKLKLKITKAAAVDASGKDAKGADAGLNPEVVRLAFSTDSGNTSAVTPLPDGSYAVVQVSGVTPPADRPFAEVKDKVQADWLAEAQKKAAEAKAKEIADKVKAGGDLAAEATALGQTVKQAVNFTRDKGDPANGVSTGFAQALFAAKLNEAAVGDAPDGPVVGKVTAITPPDPAQHPDDMATLTQAIQNQIRNDLGAQFNEALRQELKPQVNEDVVNSLIQE
jgi:peptidyl-prolyl cis-trans isomerase D